jgi:hypothetical protein
VSLKLGGAGCLAADPFCQDHAISASAMNSNVFNLLGYAVMGNERIAVIGYQHAEEGRCQLVAELYTPG